jgi:hypothetical protein
MFDKIRLWWVYDGRYYRRNFVRGVKNLWKWFPTIWKDRDYDDYYIFEVLRVKLEHQAKYIGDRDFHTTAKRDAEKMRLVARLIKLQQDDCYGMEYMEYHKTRYEFVPTDETKKLFTMEDEIISDRFEEYFAKYPRQYKRVLSGEVNRYRRPADEKDNMLIAMEIAHENQERCRKLIFKIMSDCIEEWWD